MQAPFHWEWEVPAFPREAVKRDLSLMLRAARKANIPVIVGSAGTAGGDVHVDGVLEIVREIVAEHKLKLAHSRNLFGTGQDLPQELAKAEPHRSAEPGASHQRQRHRSQQSHRRHDGRGAAPAGGLRTGRILFWLGRCSDSALFAAIPVMRGFPPGLAWHAGKVSECGTLVCETLGKGVISTTVSHDQITIRP